MSVSLASSPVNIFYNDSVDYPRLEKIFRGLRSIGIEAELLKVTESEIISDGAVLPIGDNSASKIIILTFKFNESETIRKFINERADDVDLIIIRLDDSKFDIDTKNIFNIDATIFNDELTVKWVCKKVSFLKNYSEISKSLLSRAMHWSENKEDTSLLLEKSELFEYIEWLEQAVEGKKDLNNFKLKQEFLSVSREHHLPLADAYLHCGINNPGVSSNIIQFLRDGGYEIISGNYISPKTQNKTFNDHDIRRSKNIIFIYSAQSTTNSECQRIVSYAMSMNKRIITLISPEMKNQPIPPQLDAENVVKIPTDWMFHQDFAKQIEEKLLRDQDYVEKHTKFLIKSLVWVKHKKIYKDLLKGPEAIEAGEWMATAQEENLTPAISPLQKLFIDKSIAAHSLSKNLRLGAIILSILLVFLGVLFFLFVLNGQSTALNKKEHKLIFKETNLSDVSSGEDFFNKWQKLKSNPETPNKDFLNLYYGTSRFLNQIGSTYKTITNFEFNSDGSKVLLAYGLNYFDMFDGEGNLLHRFEVKDHQIFKASFGFNEKTIFTSGSREKLCIWETDGKLLKESNPGEQLVCRDFVFLEKEKKIAFKVSDYKVIVTDELLNTISELKSANKIIRLITGQRGSELHVFTESKYFKYHKKFDRPLETADLPFAANDACLVNSNFFLLAKDGIFYKKTKNNGWEKLKMNDLNAIQLFYNYQLACFYTLSRNNGIKQWSLEGDLLGSYQVENIISYRLLNTVDKNQVLFTGTTASGQTLLYKLPVHPPFFQKVVKLEESAKRIARYNDNYFLVSNRDRISLYNIKSRRKEWTIENANKWSCIVASDKAGKIAAGDCEGIIYLFDLKGNKIKTVKAHEGKIKSLAFAPDGKEVVSAGTDHYLIKVDMDGEIIYKTKKHRSAINFVTYSRDGQHFLSAGDDQEIIVWENNGKLYNKLNGPSSSGIYADFSKTASFIVSLGLGGDYTLWDIEGNVIRFERNVEGYKPLKTFFAHDGESVILCEKNEIKGIDARGNDLFTIDLPDNIEVIDVYQSAETFDYVEILAKDKHKNSYFAAQLATNIDVLEKDFIDQVKPSI
ncbi:WD40 repeat domain-containing protein [Chondrinema litorale]|uniref:WD40 repeat domain-containing protein n=1 Tax=Chondrinema litorale TaxID=2994555 RepID=UPI002542BB83|nr:hypothetical protein [Chondrinema litorale]UZR93709.1 hypothetical protein OQ292_17830 [Chondrinema litorale]